MTTRIYWAEINPPHHLSLQEAAAPRVMLWLIFLKWPRTKQPHGLSAKCWSVGRKATPPAGIPVCTGKHQHRGQPAPGCCFGGRAAAKHLSLLRKWVQDWECAAGVWQRDNFVSIWIRSSLPLQHLAETGTGIAGTWRNFHVHQPETGSTYPHHCMCHYRTNDSWSPATFKRGGRGAFHRNKLYGPG